MVDKPLCVEPMGLRLTTMDHGPLMPSAKAKGAGKPQHLKDIQGS